MTARRLWSALSGDEYECSLYPGVVTNCLEVAFHPSTIDPDCDPLFRKQVVPAGSALLLMERALRANDDDSFDTLLFALLDYASNLSNGLAKQQRAKLRAQRAKRFIELHAYEPISLADIAKEVGVSRFTCVRQFQAHTRMTPYGYLLQVRLERAKYLLEHSHLGIEQIGAQVGFRELSHFSGFFKRATTSRRQHTARLGRNEWAASPGKVHHACTNRHDITFCDSSRVSLASKVFRFECNDGAVGDGFHASPRQLIVDMPLPV